MSTQSYHDGIKMQDISRISSQEIYQKYASVAEIFSLPQWEAISLCIDKTLTSAEAANRLGVSQRSINSRLKRAELRLFSHQQKLRAEKFRLLRSSIDFD